MKYNPKIHNRRSIRLRGFDYSQAGLYFITICTQNRTHLFGEIVGDKMVLNNAGLMIDKWYFELENKIELSKIKDLIQNEENLKLIDDISNDKYPLQIMTEYYDEVMVGRIRKDLHNENGYNIWVVANNLRKGAALNAVQIAEKLILREL